MLEASWVLLGTGGDGSAVFDAPASTGASFESTKLSSAGGFVLARLDCRNGPME